MGDLTGKIPIQNSIKEFNQRIQSKNSIKGFNQRIQSKGSFPKPEFQSMKMTCTDQLNATLEELRHLKGFQTKCGIGTQRNGMECTAAWEWYIWE